jgi:hypothetical protein
MIADVRLFPHRPSAVATAVTPRVWCFVLGGASRQQSPALLRALGRAARVAPAHRVVTILARESRSSAAAADTDVATIVQPAYRGSAAELFLPTLLVARRDPDAPSLARAIDAVAQRPGLTVLVGARPRTTRLPDGLVEPGLPLPGLEHLALHAVRRFVYEPPRGVAAASLVAPAALTARAEALVALGRRYIPEVLETLEPLEDAADTPEATLLCEAVYECMPYASLSRELLQRVSDLAVLPVPDALRDAGDAVARRLAS